MSQILEVISAPVKSGVDLRDIDSEEGRHANQLSAQILLQPGCLGVYIGHECENPSMFRMFCEWATYEDHMEFTRKEYYDKFCQSFVSLFSGPMTMYHVQCRPWPPSLVLSKSSAPVTEISLVYFPYDMSDDDRKQWVKRNDDHVRDITSRAEGFLAYSGGMVLEPQRHPDLGLAQAHFGACAWTSKDAQEEAEEAAEVEERNRLTKEAKEFPGSLSIVRVHVDLIDVQPL